MGQLRMMPMSTNHPRMRSSRATRCGVVGVLVRLVLVLVLVAGPAVFGKDQPRYAIGTVVCNAGGNVRDYKKHHPKLLLSRAEWWLRSLKRAQRPHRNIDHIVITMGFDAANDFKTAPWDRVIDVPMHSIVFNPRREGDFRNHTSMYVNNNHVQKRPDGVCTSLKLVAWRQTDYAAILLSDSDVCFTRAFNAFRCAPCF